MSLLANIKQHFCGHAFAIDELTKTGEPEDSNRRARWPCAKCGKVFFAHCGLDISPKYGPMFRREKEAR